MSFIPTENPEGPFEKGVGGFSVTQVKTLSFESLQSYIHDNHYTISHASLDNGGWSLSDDRTQALLDKLKAKGVPLGEYVQGKFYRGVLTGLNEAFVIDEETKTQLIAEDPKSAELIKPFLAGKDIKRYKPTQTNRYLILIPKGWTREQSQANKNAWDWLANNFPADSKAFKAL